MNNEYILEHILSKTTSGHDYKNFILVNKQWYNVLQKYFPEGGRFVNHLETIVLIADKMNTAKYFYDIEKLYESPSITPEFVLKYHHGYGLHKYYGMPTLTMEYIDKYPFADKIDFECLSRNTNITQDYIEQHINEKWSWKTLSYNPIITYDFVVKHKDKPWYYSYLGYNPNITLDIIISNLDKPWNFEMLSLNRSIVEKANQGSKKFWKLKNYWHYKHLSLFVTWNVVINNPGKWDYEFLSANENITWDIVVNNPDRPWNYTMLSLNPNINMKIITANSEKPWDYYKLAMNPGITIEEIANHSIMRESLGISRNPNIKYKDVVKYDLPWSISIMLNSNSFNKKYDSQFESIIIRLLGHMQYYGVNYW